MTNKQQQIATIARLSELGFRAVEIEQLLRIERTLQRWSDQECGNSNNFCSWAIERDEESGKPFRVVHPNTGNSYKTAIADREAGALKKLSKIMADHPELVSYHQGDPRGCALYIVRRADLRAGDSLDCQYTRGVAVAA